MDMDELLRRYPPEDKDKNSPGTGRARTVSRKKLIKQPSQRSLDLHGCTAEEARAEVERFLKECRRRGLRKVLIIHGKGYHSEGRPVLKKEVFRLLEQSPLAGEFGQADRAEGGSGAVWVILK